MVVPSILTENFTFQLRSKCIFAGFEDLPPSDGTNHPGVHIALPGDVTLQLLHVHYNFPSYRFRLILFVLRCNLPPSSRRSPRCSPSDSPVSPPAGILLGDFLPGTLLGDSLAGTPLGTLLGDFLAGTLLGDFLAGILKSSETVHKNNKRESEHDGRQLGLYRAL